MSRLRSFEQNNRPTSLASVLGDFEREKAPRERRIARKSPVQLAKETKLEEQATALLGDGPDKYDQRQERNAAAYAADRIDLLVGPPLRSPSGPVDKRRHEHKAYPHAFSDGRETPSFSGWRIPKNDPIVKHLVASYWIDQTHELTSALRNDPPFLPHASTAALASPDPGVIAIARRPREPYRCDVLLCGISCKCARVPPEERHPTPRRSPRVPFVVVDGASLRRYAYGLLPFGDWKERLRVEITAALCIPRRLRPSPESILVPDCPGEGLGQLLRKLVGAEWERATLGGGGGPTRKRSVAAIVTAVAREIGTDYADLFEAAGRLPRRRAARAAARRENIIRARSRNRAA